jgi:hypothetical protein
MFTLLAGNLFVADFLFGIVPHHPPPLLAGLISQPYRLAGTLEAGSVGLPTPLLDKTHGSCEVHLTCGHMEVVTLPFMSLQ